MIEFKDIMWFYLEILFPFMMVAFTIIFVNAVIHKNKIYNDIKNLVVSKWQNSKSK